MTDDRRTRSSLHPSEVHRVQRYTGPATVDEVAIRPSRAKLLRSSLRWLLVGAVPLMILPSCAVLMRREPGYFVTGMTMVAVLAGVGVLLVGMLIVWVWSHTGRRRAEYAGPVATLAPSALWIRAGRGRDELSTTWDRVAWARFVGRGERLLAIGITPEPEADPSSTDQAEPVGSGPDLDDPDPAEELSTGYTPTPPTVAPSRDEFDQLRNPPPQQQADTPEPVAPKRPKRPAAPAEPAGARWNARVHGTSYVLDIARCEPDPAVIATAFRNLTDGRIDLIPGGR